MSRQAGFNGGDGLRYFNIPGSGTQQVLDLSRQSNVGNPGRWLYRIDSKAGDCDHNGRSFPESYLRFHSLCIAQRAGKRILEEIRGMLSEGRKEGLIDNKSISKFR